MTPICTPAPSATPVRLSSMSAAEGPGASVNTGAGVGGIAMSALRLISWRRSDWAQRGAGVRHGKGALGCE